MDKKTHRPAISVTIPKLETLYTEQIKSKEIPDIEQFLIEISILESYIADYAILLFNELKLMLSIKSENYKIDMHMIIMLLGIELKNRGFSIENLRVSHKILLENPSIPFLQRFSILISKFMQEEQKFDCVYLMRGPLYEDALSYSNLKLYAKDQIKFEHEELFWNQDTGDGVFALSTTVQALDPYAARRHAYQRLEETIAFWKLYRPSRDYQIHSICLVYDERQTLSLLYDSDSINVALPSDARLPGKKIASFFNQVNKLEPHNLHHLSASVQYFRLSLLAKKQEARLMNLWIAIEALFLDIGKGSLIGKLTKYVPVIMALNYVSDICRAVPVDIKNIWRTNNTEKIRTVLPKSSESILHQDDFLQLMTIKTSSEQWEEFANLFSNNALMIFRLWKLRDGLFASPDKMAIRIEQHRNNVDWQIQRIYRLRNYIAHQGTAPMDFSQLITHLQSYYIMVVHDFIHTLRLRKLPNIKTVFESRVADYNYLISKLKDKNSNQIKTGLVTTGFSENDNPGEVSLWEE
jgi:hypothetical protein